MDRYVLIGLDGSGKSTNLNKMKQDQLFRSFRFCWVRWEPKLLLPLYRLLYKKMGSERSVGEAKTANISAVDNNYSRKQHLKKRIFRNPLIARVWLAAALVDYLIQFYRKYIPLRRSGADVVFDRYYYDLLVDQGLNIGYSPTQIVKTANRWRWMFPSIRKNIYIRVDPAVCFSRKNDIPDMDYLIRRYHVYELFGSQPGWITVDGEQDLEMVYGAVCGIILKK